MFFRLTNSPATFQMMMDDIFEDLISEGVTLSTVRSWTDRTEVRTEPNLQVLGSVLDEGEPDPYLQVRGPTLSGPDLRVEPGSDLKNSK